MFGTADGILMDEPMVVIVGMLTMVCVGPGGDDSSPDSKSFASSKSSSCAIGGWPSC